MRYFLLVLIALPALLPAAAIYKCTDQSGRVGFSSEPCAAAAIQQELPRAAPAPARDDEAMVVSEYGARLWYQWWKEGSSLMQGNFVVYNDNGYDIKDVEIACVHYGNSGTEIDRNVRTIYEVIPAGERKGVSGFNMGFIHSQAARSKCSILSVKK